MPLLGGLSIGWVHTSNSTGQEFFPVLEKSNIISSNISSDAWQSDFVVHWHQELADQQRFAENFTRVSIIYIVLYLF